MKLSKLTMHHIGIEQNGTNLIRKKYAFFLSMFEDVEVVKDEYYSG